MNELKKLVVNGQPYDIYDANAVHVNAAQNFTEPEKTQARSNVNAIGYTEQISRNLADLEWEKARISNGELIPQNGQTNAAAKEYIPVSAGTVYTASCSGTKAGGVMALYICQYDAEKTYITANSYNLKVSGSVHTVTMGQNTAYVRFQTYYGSATDWTNNIPIDFQFELGPVATEYSAPGTTYIEWDEEIRKLKYYDGLGLVTQNKFMAVKNPTLKQIAHQGYCETGAPPCTAPAYILAKQIGFDAGENDLRVTSDGVFVTAHEDYVKSDTSVTISGNTYATLQNHNMGTFNGKTCPIMTFEEWLFLMKKIGLEPYIHIKIADSAFTAETAASAVAIVRNHGMLENVTWCTNVTKLALIRQVDPMARGAIISETTVHDGVKPLIIAGRPDLTVLNPQSTQLVNSTKVQQAYAAGVGMECWHAAYSQYGFDTEEKILAEIDRVFSLGITGISLDTYLPGDHFINNLKAEWGIE